MLFVVATYDGKLLLLNYSGELVEIVENSPKKKITCMIEYERGIIVGGEDGKFWVYQTNPVDNDSRNSLKLFHTNDQIVMESNQTVADIEQEKKAIITSLAVPKTGDCLYLMTDTKQLLTVNPINLDGSEIEKCVF